MHSFIHCLDRPRATSAMEINKGVTHPMESVKQRRQPHRLRPFAPGRGHLLLELEEPRCCDEHHERLGQLLDSALEQLRRLPVPVRATNANASTTPGDSRPAADAGAALEGLHDEHPMLGEEAARGALRDAALRAAGEHGGTDDARHAHQQRVVPLQCGGAGRVLEELRVRSEEARLLNGREEVGLQGVLGALARLADGQH